jgi:hypothetical protein
MEDNPSASERSQSNPLQPVHELIQGGDPDLICTRYGISRAQLEKLMSAYQASRREAAVADAFAPSKTGRNDPCPCGSGKKYKKCCLPVHQEARNSIPKEQLQQMEEKARAKEKLEKEVGKGFELIFSREYVRAERYAKERIEVFQEDDRFHDILVSACFGLGDYDSAFRIARKRWQTAVEEKLFFQENGYHKREGIERDSHVQFYSPSTWLEKFWIAQRARVWREQYDGEPPSAGCALAESPRDGEPPLAGCALAESPRARRGEAPPRGIDKLVEDLLSANDSKRFPAKQEEGFETRRAALAPVLEKIKSEGREAIPFLLPITYNFNWAALFVPELLHAWSTDECLRLLAELSMFRYPYFSQKCLACLEDTGERAIAAVSLVLEENPAFDELKAGLLNVLGNLACRESFGVLVKFTEHENRYVVAWACEALGRHKNPEALPYLEKAKQRMGAMNQIAGAIKELAGLGR